MKVKTKSKRELEAGLPTESKDREAEGFERTGSGQKGEKAGDLVWLSQLQNWEMWKQEIKIGVKGVENITIFLYHLIYAFTQKMISAHDEKEKSELKKKKNSNRNGLNYMFKEYKINLPIKIEDRNHELAIKREKE